MESYDCPITEYDALALHGFISTALLAVEHQIVGSTPVSDEDWAMARLGLRRAREIAGILVHDLRYPEA